MQMTRQQGATSDLEAWIVSLAWRKTLESTAQVGRKHYLNCVSDAESEVIGAMDRAGLDAVQIPAITARRPSLRVLMEVA